MSGDLVLVTGGSGFIGLECVNQLLAQNYRVRTSVRSLKREEEVRSTLKIAGATNLDNLTFVEADLSKDANWVEAAKDCKYVLHVASPFPPGPPKHEDELVIPAREGTLRVLRAAKDAGTVERVVLTSSFAALGYGPGADERELTENDWSDEGPDKGKNLGAYQKSKTVAERAAWEYIDKEGGDRLSLSVINPVLVLGPIYSKDFSTSVELIQRMLNGSLPGCPALNFGVVDVRDVASLHLAAMTNPRASGERFIASSEFMWVSDMARVLRERLPEKSKKVPTRNLPNFLLKIAGIFDPGVRLVTPELGKKKTASNEHAKALLDWKPRSGADAVVASAESLFERGVVKI